MIRGCIFYPNNTHTHDILLLLAALAKIGPVQTEVNLFIYYCYYSSIVLVLVVVRHTINNTCSAHTYKHIKLINHSVSVIGKAVV